MKGSARLQEEIVILNNQVKLKQNTYLCFNKIVQYSVLFCSLFIDLDLKNHLTGWRTCGGLYVSKTTWTSSVRIFYVSLYHHNIIET